MKRGTLTWLAIGVACAAAVASHWGYASATRRLLDADLADTREQLAHTVDQLTTSNATLRLAQTESTMLRVRAEWIESNLKSATQTEQVHTVGFAQLAGLYESEHAEADIYRAVLLRSIAAAPAGTSDSQLLTQMRETFARSADNLARAAKDVADFEAIMAARPGSQAWARYRAQLALLDTRAWTADRLPARLESLATGLPRTPPSTTAADSRTRSRAELLEWSTWMRDVARAYRARAITCQDASREAQCRVRLSPEWTDAGITLTRGEVFAVSATSPIGPDWPADSGIGVGPSVLLWRIAGTDHMLSGTPLVRPQMEGRLEVRIDEKILRSLKGVLEVRMWIFRPLESADPEPAAIP